MANSRLRYVTIEGETHTINEWAKLYNVSRSTIVWRMSKGIVGKDIVKKAEKRIGQQITIEGKTHGVADWSRISGVSELTIRNRYKNGVRGKRLIKETTYKTNGRHDICFAKDMSECFNCKFADCIRPITNSLSGEQTVDGYIGSSIFKKKGSDNGVSKTDTGTC